MEHGGGPVLNYWELKRRAEQEDGAVLVITPVDGEWTWTLIEVSRKGEPVGLEELRQGGKRLMACVGVFACSKARKGAAV